MILGIDEVGRGPWAGPLVVGAVILGDTFSPEQINLLSQKSQLNDQETEQIYLWQNLTDSKQLTVTKRQRLEPLITKYAAASATGWVSADELDQYGLSAALKLATRRAVKQILATKTPFSEIIIDGTINFLQNTPLFDHTTTLKKADLLVKEVSAASIIAKVARDNYMAEIALQYPAYGFEKNVGYGTALHRKALLEQGICPEHRKSFRPVREIMGNFDPKGQNEPPAGDSSNVLAKAPSSTACGKKAEIAVARYLKTQNHQILSQNYKTKAYEIDLISIYQDEIFFTEVKYSKNLQCEGSPLVRITPSKQQQMQFAAECFLNGHPEYQKYTPKLALASVSGPDFQNLDWFTL